jgi:hypothetical protein
MKEKCNKSAEFALYVGTRFYRTGFETTHIFAAHRADGGGSDGSDTTTQRGQYTKQART